MIPCRACGGIPGAARADWRAALRDAIHALTEYTSGTRTDATIAELRAIADAPPTVADLLPMVDATHEVRWTSRSGTLCRCLLDDRGEIAWIVEAGPQRL